MEAITYRLEQFEGPLELLLTLIQKNKVNIEDIPISLICDQYMEYITEAQNLDMDIASEFILMASELMLIKSKMLLPRDEEDEEDPRKELADALLRYSQAKEAAAKMQPMYAYHSARMIKDTDEISIDRTFVADQSVESLCMAVRRIISYNIALRRAADNNFKPMISKPIVPVEAKIVGIIGHLKKKKNATLGELLSDSVSLPDMIAIFIGVLELIKVNKISIVENPDELVTLHGSDTKFIINDDYAGEEDVLPEITIK